LLRHPGEGMRERGEDVDLHEGKLVGLGETTRHQDAAAVEIDVEHALGDKRERVAGVELEDVVRHAGRDVLHEAEPAPSLFLHLEADELEDVVAVLAGRRQLGAGHLEPSPSLDRPVEAHDDPSARALRIRDGGRRAAGEEPRADGKAIGILARALDDEGAVEPMRAADAADRNKLGRSVQDVASSLECDGSGEPRTQGACVSDIRARPRTQVRARPAGPRDSEFILNGAMTTTR
jgi:hypothetical protein